MARHALRVLHWNANGLRGKHRLLLALLHEQDIDVCLISETHLASRDTLKAPTYYVYRQDELSDYHRAYRGLAILVKRRLVHQAIPPLPDLKSLRALGVELHMDGSPIRVFAVYKPPITKLDTSDLDQLLDPKVPTILAGDLNCKHTAWNSNLISLNGRILLDHADRRGYTVQGPETPTHYPYTDAHAPDVLDIALFHGLNSQPTQEVLLEDLQSDHLPVLLVIPSQPTSVTLPVSRSRTDWRKFSDIIQESAPMLPTTTPEDVEQLAVALTACIKDALEKASATTPANKRYDPISARARDLIAQKRCLRREWQRTRCPQLKRQLNALTERVKNELISYKSERWEKLIGEAGDEPTKVHRLCRQISKRPAPVRPLQGPDGLPIYRAPDRAELFAKHLESQFKPNPINDQSHANQITEYLNTYFKEEIRPDECPLFFSPNKVKKYINKTKLKKAPGPDGISNIVLRHLPTRGVISMTRLFNGVLRTCHYPQQWKVGHVIMIPKAGKNILKPESYRPITLLSTISKVFEKMFLSHLIPHITPRQEQFGFRPEHSTTLQIARLLHDAAVALNKKEYTVAVFLDMEKAFDRVWHEGLVYKLATSTAPRRMVKTIASFLKDRRFRVVVEDAVSEKRSVEAGVPQGSCLSPALYSRFTDDIPLEEGAQLALYADDAAYYASSLRRHLAANRIQRTLDALPEWLAKWRLSVNVSKTQAIVIKAITSMPPPLRLQGLPIQWSPNIKYLGVNIDSRLSMLKHVKEIANKTRAVRNILRPVLSSNLPLNTKTAIYKVYIRPHLTYAAPAWYQLISETSRRKLQAQQSLSLRTLASAPRYVRNATLHRDLKIETIQDFVGRLAKQMFVRAEASHLPHIRDLAPLHARPPDSKALPRDLTNTNNTDVQVV